MKLTLVQEEVNRSLQRRWLLNGAEPVAAKLPPYDLFVPEDVRIWWSAEDGQPAEENTLHANAWPADRRITVFADWRLEREMPEWAKELSSVVHSDLLANTTSTNTGVEDRWAHSLKRKWTMAGVDAIPASYYNKEALVPVDLSIWWSFNVGLGTSEDRYSIYAHSAGRDGRRSPEQTAQWGSSRASFACGTEDLPEWIRELADAQYVELEAIAAAHTAEREAR